MSVSRICSFINGEFSQPLSGRWLENHDPATGQVYSEVADSNADDVAMAVESATAASAKWSRVHVDERSGFLHRMANSLNARLDAFVQAESRDTGKPVWLARDFEIPRVVQNFRFFASLVAGAGGESYDSPAGLNVTHQVPWGVGGVISPWNLPLYLFSWKIAPALATGNCLVAKPSELTPMTAMMLGEVCQEVGLPPGVLNILQGTGPTTGQAIVEHPGVKAISFTGGTKTGATIASTAAPLFKKVSLELGGKNPNLIFADCDFHKMLATTIRSSFQNSGQVCLCGSRIYVERSIYDRFLEAFVSAVQQLKVGDPKDPATKMGPVISKPHQEKILGAIHQAVSDGGTVLCGGMPIQPEGRCSNGWFVSPTIITGMNQTCAANQDEIFGPVVTVQPFSTDDEAVSLANQSRYGLSSTVWTSNLNRAMNVSQQIESGVVWINGWLVRDLRTPFGGMKQSGVGREGGWEGLKFWTQEKNICFCN